MKVFDIGFPKTATSSIEKALRILGYDVCQGYWRRPHTYYLCALWANEDYDEIFRMVRHWDAFADGPWGGTSLYKEVHRRMPSAKFILTIRPSKAWYRSFAYMFTPKGACSPGEFAAVHNKRLFGTAYFFEKVFQIKSLAGNKQKVIGLYEVHNQRAIDYFSGTGKLLVLNVPADLTWKKLCSFLGKAIPKRDFPWANRTKRG